MVHCLYRRSVRLRPVGASPLRRHTRGGSVRFRLGSSRGVLGPPESRTFPSTGPGIPRPLPYTRRGLSGVFVVPGRRVSGVGEALRGHVFSSVLRWFRGAVARGGSGGRLGLFSCTPTLTRVGCTGPFSPPVRRRFPTGSTQPLPRRSPSSGSTRRSSFRGRALGLT